jgi:hypothetical protein
MLGCCFFAPQVFDAKRAFSTSTYVLWPSRAGHAPVTREAFQAAS